jgi:NADPH:quinone reductase-like Zn-dependent oxidoreductase
VVATSADVGDIMPGDKVMGIGPAAFSTHVRVRRDGVTKLPEGMDTVAAATVPVAFLTAYYAMIELGHIQPEETILIHGAAGGVGLAALQIAKLKGAKVIATAGTVEKRRFLELLGADHVFDSRSLDFVTDIRAVTDGKGVDLVLNSLFSEAMERHRRRSVAAERAGTDEADICGNRPALLGWQIDADSLSCIRL